MLVILPMLVLLLWKAGVWASVITEHSHGWFSDGMGLSWGNRLCIMAWVVMLWPAQCMSVSEFLYYGFHNMAVIMVGWSAWSLWETGVNFKRWCKNTYAASHKSAFILPQKPHLQSRRTSAQERMIWKPCKWMKWRFMALTMAICICINIQQASSLHSHITRMHQEKKWNDKQNYCIWSIGNNKSAIFVSSRLWGKYWQMKQCENQYHPPHKILLVTRSLEAYNEGNVFMSIHHIRMEDK